MRQLAGILLVTWLVQRGVAATEFEFVPLGNLRGSADFGKRSEAYGVSPDGQAVVGVSLSSVGLGDDDG